MKPWLKNKQNASAKDKAAAENVMKDTQNALNGKIMSSLPVEYLQSIVTDIPILNTALNHCLQGWGTEIPPDTIVFGEVGDAIVENLERLSKEERRKLFAKIEEGMVSHDDSIRTAMATGLVEALVSKVDQRLNNWIELQNLLEPTTLKHAIAWRIFGE